MRILLMLGVIASLALGHASKAGTVSFLDTGNGTNYSVAFQYKSDPSVSSTLGICASCGNSGAAIDFEVTVGQIQPLVAYYGGFLNQTLTYNPLVQGAITTIATSMDKNFSDTTAVNFNNRARLLLNQDGNFYVTVISGGVLNGPGTTGFLNFSASGLLATDFQQVDPATGRTSGNTPNFAGDPIVFGIAQALASSGVPNTGVSAVYDNVSIVLTTAAVPEPGTLGLLAAGLGGMTLLRRRRTAD